MSNRIERAGLGILLLVALGAGVSCTPAHVGGEGLYFSRCAYCHGDSGRGDGPAGVTMDPAPPDLTSDDYWAARTRASVAAAILAGSPGTAMPGYEGILDEEELGMLMDHLETLRAAGTQAEGGGRAAAADRAE